MLTAKSSRSFNQSYYYFSTLNGAYNMPTSYLETTQVLLSQIECHITKWLAHTAPQQPAPHRCVQYIHKVPSEFQAKFSCAWTWHNSKFSSE